MSRAVSLYRSFHSHEPRGTRTVAGSIPKQAHRAGAAVNVLYASDKLNPTTGEDEGWIDYIHDHNRGVVIYRCDEAAAGKLCAVPAWITNVTELVVLGDCLGFAYEDETDGHVTRAKGKRPLPELCAIPSGKALVVVQDKRNVLAIIWGGKLGVLDRGIVG